VSEVTAGGGDAGACIGSSPGLPGHLARMGGRHACGFRLPITSGREWTPTAVGKLGREARSMGMRLGVPDRCAAGVAGGRGCKPASASLAPLLLPKIEELLGLE
jgi:hypothetical protein